MLSEKIIKKGDVYLSGNDIVGNFNIAKSFIYDLYNKLELRYIFKKISRHGQFCNIIHFNLDDVRKNIKINGCLKYKKSKLETKK